MDDRTVEDGTADEESLLELPDELRSAFKDPFGPVYTDPETLLTDAGRPVIAVGDIVTYHLESAQFRPHVALVDGRTERHAVDEEVREALGDGDRHVINPPGTLTAQLLATLVTAIQADDPSCLVVDGEEDLATIPAVIAAPIGATVVYGQPGEGMVAVAVTPGVQAEFRDLLERLDGDTQRALELLE
jgi:uncharacterized protein (UPF0218 family)